MSTGNPKPPGTALQSSRVNSFSQFFKKSLSSAKNQEPSVPPEAGSNGNAIPGYARPQRHHDLTEADLRNKVTALQTSVNEAWPHRHHSRYRQARALLVCWSDIDLNDDVMPHGGAHTLPQPTEQGSLRFSSGSAASFGGKHSSIKSTSTTGRNTRDGPFVPAALQLEDVLERRYDIRTQVWMIPSLENPQDVLAGKVRQFVEAYGGPDNLLIFWYGGRAEFVSSNQNEDAAGSDKAAGEVIWYGLRDHLGISARAITKTLGGARADVLMFNDSPFSQYAYTGHLNGPGTFELIGSGSMTPAGGGQMQPSTMTGRERDLEREREREASFTRTLALMLDSPFLATRGVSVPELHRKLLDLATPAARVSVSLSLSPEAPAPAPTAPLPPLPPLPPPSSSSSLLSSSVPSANNAGLAPLPHPNRAHSNRPFSASSSSSPSRIVAHARRPSRLPAYPVYCQIAQAALLERDVRPNIVLSRLDTSLVTQSGHARPLPGHDRPGVKLELRLTRHLLDVRRWKDWILRAPPEVQGVLVDTYVADEK